MGTVNLFHGLRRLGGNTDFTDYLAVFPILAMLWCTELPTNTTTYVCVCVRALSCKKIIQSHFYNFLVYALFLKADVYTLWKSTCQTA